MTAINRAAEQALTPVMVREIFTYCSVTGLLRWRVTRGRRAIAGDVAGRVEKVTGYVRVGINGRDYMVHRLIWAYMLGRWPIDIVDHRDRNRSNNRWMNLRAATYATNNRNKKVKIAASGLKGAHRKGSKWSSTIQVDGKQIHLGHFSTAAEAHEAYVEAVKRYHGEFNSLEIV